VVTTTPQDRSRPPRESVDLRAATLDAAAALFAAEGLSGLVVRRIAAAAGCSTMAVYHYFDGKQGLLEALYLEGHRRLSDAQHSWQFTDDPEADVRNTCLAYREVALAHPGYFQVMFGHQPPGIPRPSGEIRARARENYARFIAVVRRWGEQHPLVTDAESAAHVLWATGHGLVMLELTGNAPRADLAARYVVGVDVAMRGLQQ
jgi:AcrR family transcriptional regulator